MGLIDDEKGTSEVVGAMLLLAIFVIVLGGIQNYGVPSWNKDTERQQFDIIHYDFLNIRSDIQDVYISNIPKTSSLSMGVKYPERYMLRNPGSGASGTLTYEPVNVTLKVGSATNYYNSTRIRYSMNGISNQPALVYEYGLVIRDFGGNKSLNESAQSLISGNDINIPVLFAQGQQSVGSMLPESLTINALSTGNYTVKYNTSTTVNITLPTRYPDLWKNLTKNIQGVNVTGNGSAGNITINRTVNNLIYPKENPSGGIYSGLISTTIPANLQPPGGGPSGVPIGPTGPLGHYTNEEQSINRINIPSSIEIKKFAIDNINVANTVGNMDHFEFVVTDKDGDRFKIYVGFSSNNTKIDKVELTNGTTSNKKIYENTLISDGIDLTSYYNSSSIDKPNSLMITNWNAPPGGSNILYFRLLICDTDTC